MNKSSLREESGSMIYDWRPDLAPKIVTRILHDHSALQKHRLEDRSRIRRAVEILLAHLGSAIRLARPQAFADYLADTDALPSAINRGSLDRVMVLKQMRDSLTHYTPEMRARLARGFIQLALSRCAVRGNYHHPRRHAA